MSMPAKVPLSVSWEGQEDGFLRLLDQTQLPLNETYRDCRTVDDVWEAIRSLQVRGAPAIGIAAAYGICLGAAAAPLAAETRQTELQAIADRLATSRPTAVNLFWALDRQLDCARAMSESASPAQVRTTLLAEARRIHADDRESCHAIGRHGATLLADGSGVLTHCNAGGLATAEYGTALAVIYAAHEAGKQLHVYADETRPLLQGARLTAWELQRHGVPTTLICDSMAAHVMKEGRVQAVVVGADRIAANGDAANKIGTYGLALLAHAHQIPFYVAAPCSTFDLSLPTGDGIPIEQRGAAEVAEFFGSRTAPPGIHVYNPAFDVTPARYIRAIITERGLIQPVTADHVRAVVGSN
ncbi:MAG: S-methyl-5-thioribose-1-phosphate isomerase [Planctomycetales bacterium]|nr:S-methyl-5-thioribose-1-phosphate isomerase [Planctomycetales bacterium]